MVLKGEYSWRPRSTPADALMPDITRTWATMLFVLHEELPVPLVLRNRSGNIFIFPKMNSLWQRLKFHSFWTLITSQIARFMWPTWGPPRSCWPQVGPMLAPWYLLSGVDFIHVRCCWHLGLGRNALTHWGLVMHISVSKLTYHHWFR